MDPLDDEGEYEYEFGDDYRPRVRLAKPPPEKPGLANAAGVLWVTWSGVCLLAALAHVWAVGTAIRSPAYTPAGLCSAFVLLLATVICLVAGLRTLFGRPRSLAGFAVLSFVSAAAIILVHILSGAAGESAGHNPYGEASHSYVLAVLLVSGVLLAGVFALLTNGRYRRWYDRGRG